MQDKNYEYPSSKFLKSLYQHCGEAFIKLRLISPAGHVIEKFIPLSAMNSIPSVLEAYKDRNCFFGMALRNNGDGSKQGISEIPALWIDLDFYKLTDRQKQESRKKCKDFP